MQLEPIDDWDTIDDELLSNLIYKTTDQTRKNENSTSTKTVANVKSAKNPPQNVLKSQINTVNTVHKTTTGRILPQMYFPNSNVTINYHFHK